jgi:hypothetical protein
VRNFHSLSLRHSPEKFPHGMKWLAEQIRPLGFKPGIWTVPWGTGDDKFYQEHRAWFLHDSKGQPFQNWNGRYILDPSQPEVRRHMEETHRIMSAEWGYEMFKVDGMSFSVRMFERPDVRAAFRQPCTEPFQLSLEALRRGMGPDRIVLACNGHYPGPEVPFFDAARIGGDLVSPGKPPNWNSYLSQARVTLAQLFVHNLIWYNDPDTLMVGEVTPLSMARVATTIVALPGQLTFISDKLRQLPAQRMRLLQQALPVCDVRPLDLMPISDLKPVWDLKIRRRFASWDVVSIFNWGDEAQDYRIAFETLGLDAKKAYLLYEFWSGMFHGVRRGFINTHVEPQSNLLLAVHELKDHPQFLSTDRHISQGGVELIDVAWKAERGELVSRVKLVENDILTMSVHVPADYAYREAIATGATVEDVGGIGAVKTVLLRRATSGEAELTLSFTRQSQVGQ